MDIESHSPIRARRCCRILFLAVAIPHVLAALTTATVAPNWSLAEYQKQDWQVEDGLPESNVRMITQLPSGELLLATFSGAFTFDGIHFTAASTRNSAATNVDAVNAVIPGKQHDLWIGTDGRGVIHQTEDGATNISEVAGHSNERIRSLYLQGDTLWIATQNGIERYIAGILSTVPNTGIIAGDLTTQFASGSTGGVYFVTARGLFFSTGTDTQRIPVPASFGAPVAVYRDKQQRLWVGTMTGLLEAIPHNDQWEWKQRMQLPSQVTALAGDHRGNLWVGTKHNGLWTWNGTRTQQATTRNGLPDDTVRALYVDDEDNLWIGMLTGGISRWRRAPFAPFVTDKPLQGGYTASVFADSHNNIWLGTWGRGLFRARNGQVKPFPLPDMSRNNAIRAIAEDKHGRIWIGTWFNGIYSIDGDRVQHYLLGIESPVNAVSAILADRDGGLWVGTYTGLLHLPDGTPTGKRTWVLQQKLVTDLLQDSDGSILTATTGGLIRIRNQQAIQITGLEDQYVLSLLKDKLGHVWAAPRGGGLRLVQKEASQPLLADSGFPQYPIYNSVTDTRGQLWMGTSRGIVRVNPADLYTAVQQHAALRAVNFGKADGMPSSDCSGPSRPSAAALADGTILFATSGGFVHTNPAEKSSISPLPPATITGWTYGDHGNVNPLPPSDYINLTPTQSDVVFYLGAKHLSNPWRVEFRYKLADYDNDWIITKQRFARYQKLRPGTYRFLVQAHLTGEPWPAAFTTLTVRQEPHLYQTYTFYMLLCVLVFALGAYLYTRRIRQVKGTLGLVLEERNRIAREVHDSLMAGFAAIGWQMETTTRMMHDEQSSPKTMESMELTRSMVSHCQAEARRIIYDLRDTDEVTGLLSKAVAESIRRHYRRDGVEAIMSVEGEEVLLPPTSVHHLVSIAQESMSNALKHGEPTQVHVHLRYVGGTLTLSIKDNGKGFTPDRSSARRGHFGIMVMEERARKIGGRVRIQSSSAGTEVIVTLTYAATTNLTTRTKHVVRWIGI